MRSLSRPALFLGIVALATGPVLAGSGSKGSKDSADRVFVGGKIWTGVPGAPLAEAIAVRGSQVLDVGSSAEIMKRTDKKITDVVQLKGRLVVPGFIDAHVHFLSGSQALSRVDLSDAQDVEQVQRKLLEFASKNPGDDWILGRGWVYSAFEGGLPHRQYLDGILAARPVFLTSYDGHTGWCNSRALELARIGRINADPPGGQIVRDPDGEPTGVLKEAAMDLVRRALPDSAEEENYRALKRGMAKAAQAGVTSVHNAGLDVADLPLFERALSEGELKVRFYQALPLEKDPTEAQLQTVRGLRDRYAGPVLRFGAVKGFVDGVVESRTAAMFEPLTGGGNGAPLFTAEQLNKAVAVYDKEGFQIELHAIGDKAIAMALDAYEAAAKANGTAGKRRHRIEHVEVPRLADLARFKTLSVIASTQALFAEPNRNHLDVYVPALGPERAARAMPFKAIDDAGVTQAFGSDWPVYPLDPLRGIHVAVNRTTPDGLPPAGWEPAQKIGVEAALRHFTADAAYASFEESSKGKLVEGALADLVVLSQDVLTIPPDQIAKTKVLLTVMGGQDIYRSREY